MHRLYCDLDEKQVGAVGRWAKPYHSTVFSLPTMKKIKWAVVGAVGENFMPTALRPLAKNRSGRRFLPSKRLCTKGSPTCPLRPPQIDKHISPTQMEVGSMSLSEHFMQELSKMNEAIGTSGARPSPATVPVVPVAEIAGTRNGNAANPYGSKVVPAENNHSLNCCPLRLINSLGFHVEPIPDKGLVLHCDFSISEPLKAHTLLWVMPRFDALLNALDLQGAGIPRRVKIHSRSRYTMPKE